MSNNGQSFSLSYILFYVEGSIKSTKVRTFSPLTNKNPSQSQPTTVNTTTMVWTCLTCTFDNENQGLACVMCQTERISTSSTTAPAAMNKRNNDDDDNSSVIAISPHPARVPPKKQRCITQYTTQWEKTSETPSGWAQTNDPIASQCATQCATQYVTQCSTGCANHSVELEDDLSLIHI